MAVRPARLGSSVFKTVLHPSRPPLRSYASVAEKQLPTALFFPGHGVQRRGMLKPWLEAGFPTCKEFMQETDEILQCNLTSLMTDGTNETLDKSENAQPVIMACSIMILRLLEKEFGFKTKDIIDVTLGHSLGEYAALVAAGYLDYAFALRMVRRRGEIMGECTRKAKEESGDSYGMMALVLEDEPTSTLQKGSKKSSSSPPKNRSPSDLTTQSPRLESLISTVNQFLEPGSHGSKDDSSAPMTPISLVRIANINSKNQIVLSGSFSRIKNLLVQIREFGGHDPRAVEVRSNSPFHSPLMEPAYKYMKTTMHDGPVNWPGNAVTVSNVTGRPFESEQDIRTLLPRQTTETVQWYGSLVYLDQEAGTKRWLGLGPGKVGRNLVGKQVGRSVAKGGGVWAISDPKELEPTLRSFEDAAKGEQHG